MELPEKFNLGEKGTHTQQKIDEIIDFLDGKFGKGTVTKASELPEPDMRNFVEDTSAPWSQANQNMFEKPEPKGTIHKKSDGWIYIQNDHGRDMVKDTDDEILRWCLQNSFELEKLNRKQDETE